MPASYKDLGTILIEENKLTNEQYGTLFELSRKEGKTLEENIRASGLVSQEDIVQATSKLYGVPYIDLVGKIIPQKILSIIPENIARNYKMAAIELSHDKLAVKVAMLYPQDVKAREALRYLGREQNLKIEYLLATTEGLDFVFKQYANIREEVGKALKSAEERFKPKADDQTDDGKNSAKSERKKASASTSV